MTTHARAGEEALVSRAADRGESLGVLAATYRPVLEDWCRRWVGDRDEAQDLASEALLRASGSIRSFVPRGPGALRAWLFRIALNLCRDHLRRRGRAAIPTDPSDALLQASPSPQPDRTLWLVVEQLSEPLRAAVLLRVRYEFPYSDIARVLGCRAGTARWRAHEGLRQLAEMMSDEGI